MTLYGLWGGICFLRADNGNIYQSENRDAAETQAKKLLADGAAGVEVREIPADLYDHMAYSCGECGSVAVWHTVCCVAARCSVAVVVQRFQRRGPLRNREVVMTDWQQRVVEEKQELDSRLFKLRAFLGSPKVEALESMERYQLQRQEFAMSEYSGILRDRIKAFK